MEVLKQILLNIPQGLATGLFFNGSVIVITYFIVWKWLKKNIQHLRIQLKERVDGAQIKRELKNSVYSLLVGATFSSFVFYLNSLGYTKIYTDINEHSLFFSISGFFILLFVDDTWFYWIHRLLHHPKIFRFIHLEHHKSVDVNPFTSMSFHFLETLLLTLWVIPFSFIFPIYAPLLLLVQVWGLLDNIKSHLGYEFYPAWWNKSILGGLTSSTYHNMHHAKFKGNYGVHFRFWDRLMKTEFKDYETEFTKIKERKRAHI